MPEKNRLMPSFAKEGKSSSFIHDEPTPFRLISIATIGVLAVSLAAIFIRWCQAPALAIAAYRLCISSLVLIVLGYRKWPVLLQNLESREWRIAAISGLFLAIHFGAWISSLEMTSVASSVVLVSTSPFWAALGAWLFLKARIQRFFVFGFLLAFAGMIVIASQGSNHQDSFAGNALALIGAIGGAGYMLCGRYLRAKLDTLSYVMLAYTFAGVFLLLLVLASGTPLSNFSWQTYGLFLLIALVPQLVGHTSFNWALKYLSTPVVSTIMLGEPVFATIFAFLLLSEIPSLSQVAGCLLILLGVALSIWSDKS